MKTPVKDPKNAYFTPLFAMNQEAPKGVEGGT